VPKKKSKEDVPLGISPVEGTKDEQIHSILTKLNALDPVQIHGMLVVVGTAEGADNNRLNVYEFMAGDESTLKALHGSQLVTLAELFPAEKEFRGVLH
jgi:hypothetical protein